MIDTIVRCPRLIVVPNNPSINRQGQVWNANELDHIVEPAGGKLARDTNDDPLFYDNHDALVVCITDASLTDTLVDVLVALGYMPIQYLPAERTDDEADDLVGCNID